MAKSKKDPQIEEAEIVTDEVAESTQETELKPQFPAIPDRFYVEGKEYSVEKVSELESRATELLKKATPDSYENKKLWEQINDLKQEAVKMRTTPENKRKEVSKPINDFLKTLKSKTDAIGDEAARVQKKIDEVIAKRENWEEEKRKAEEERIQKRTNERISMLYDKGAKFNPDSNSYTLNFGDHGVYNIHALQLADMDEQEWIEEFAQYRQAHADKVAAEAKEKAEAEAEAQRVKDEADALKAKEDKLMEKQLKLRTKELTSNGAGFVNGHWVLNKVYFSPEDLRDLEDEDWDDKIEQALIPVEEPVMEEASQPTPEPPVAQPLYRDPRTEEGQGYTSDPYPEQPADPLAEVIQQNVEAHEHHQATVDGLLSVELQFTKEEPFIDFFVAGKSRMRIFPADYEEQASREIPQDWVLNASQVGEADLFFILYKRKD